MQEQQIGDIAIEAIDQIIECEGIFVSEEIARTIGYDISTEREF